MATCWDLAITNFGQMGVVGASMGFWPGGLDSGDIVMALRILTLTVTHSYDT